MKTTDRDSSGRVPRASGGYSFVFLGASKGDGGITTW